jgi:signal transduction histidine kinase
MSSLRSRLILGSSVIAVVPLAVAILLLSHRMGATMRAQASSRLDATLGALRTQLESDGRTTSERIRLLARDPQLRRLYLVRPETSADLAGYLAERRFLLGLDVLRILDTTGVEVANGAAAGGRTSARPASAGVAPAEGVATARAAGDSALAMVARAPILYAGRPAGVLEGALLLDAGALVRLRTTSGIDLVLSDPAGHAVAATRREPAGPAFTDTTATGRVSVAGRSYLARTVPLAIGPAPYPRITGLVSTTRSDETIAALQWAAALLGLLGLALAIALALVWSSQVSRPVERLAAFSDRIARGEWDQPLALESVRELEALVTSLDRMRRELGAQRERLVTSERQAAWGQMAREIAHEARNPLTPIAISVADLKRSYEIGRPEFPQILDQAVRTIGEEVETLRRLLQEFADFGRLPAPRRSACRVADLLDHLEALYAGEIAVGRLAVLRPGRDVTLRADAGQVRQALVNLVQNGLEALEDEGRVTVSATTPDGAVEIAVSDTGPGLTEAQRANLFVPGFTTKTRGSGLGLTIVERIVSDHGGTISVQAGAGRGTTVRVRLPLESVGDAAGHPPGAMGGARA